MNRLEQQDRMEKMVDYMAHYWSTYNQQPYYLDYSDTIFLEDALYAIGVALDKKYKNANGYRDFKKYLKEFIDE